MLSLWLHCSDVLKSSFSVTQGPGSTSRDNRTLSLSFSEELREIRLIMFFAAEDGEALYSQQKQDQEMTVAQTMNYLLPNSGLN